MLFRGLSGFLVLLVVLPGVCGVTVHAANILFISSMDPTHMPGDDALKAFMEGLGHTVTYLDDNEAEPATEAAAEAADLVFISESVSSSGIRNEITGVETPIITTEAWAWDEMGLTYGGGAGQNVVTTEIKIVAPDHPLAAGLMGTVSVLTGLTSARGTARLGNGVAGEQATVIATATLADGKTYDVLFLYEKGAALPVAPADGSPQAAADIRICLGLDEISYLAWNANAYALLKAAVDYALGSLSDAGLASGPSPADGAVGVLLPFFTWRPGNTGVLHKLYLGADPNLGEADLAMPLSHATTYYHVRVLQPGTTYYWRVDEVEKDMTTIHTGNVWSFTTQALTAYLPKPADGALDAPTNPDLKWWAGQTAMEHHVYFSESLDAVSRRTADADKGLRALTDANYAPGALESVTTYYWCVDEIGMDQAVIAGPIWSFTTHLPIDDFESYTDEVGQRIFQTWLDGYGYTEPTVVPGNGTGATVGHTDPPFAEQTIVLGGAQSMPMDYNNVASPYYSEAERTFAPAVDWTVRGAAVLVLHLRGRAGNSPASLYVAVQDASKHTGVVTHPDPTVVTSSKWIEWKVPLSEFAGLGVDAARIAKMSVGVGNRSAPQPGGAGNLFIDDIYLTKTVAGQ